MVYRLNVTAMAATATAEPKNQAGCSLIRSNSARRRLPDRMLKRRMRYSRSLSRLVNRGMLPQIKSMAWASLWSDSGKRRALRSRTIKRRACRSCSHFRRSSWAVRRVRLCRSV